MQLAKEEIKINEPQGRKETGGYGKEDSNHQGAQVPQLTKEWKAMDGSRKTKRKYTETRKG